MDKRNIYLKDLVSFMNEIKKEYFFFKNFFFLQTVLTVNCCPKS